MNAKEKAEELINWYRYQFGHKLELAKKCATITANDFEKQELKSLNIDSNTFSLERWDDVRKEIQIYES